MVTIKSKEVADSKTKFCKHLEKKKSFEDRIEDYYKEDMKERG